MKALSILGTSSGAGKTWTATALCSWLRRQGLRVAPFKAQNMSNNALATPAGGEIARAQAVQAEACGLLPDARMNPILLKPSGGAGSQLVVLGEPQGHLHVAAYYNRLEELWEVVKSSLEHWRSHCDVLVVEGAGSPVELNLMDLDLANLRTMRHLDARWLLVADIDRGGVFAQLAGTWTLLPADDRRRSLGAIINRFRGDISHFPDPNGRLTPYAEGLRVLGTVPYRDDLRPDEEDGLDPCDGDRGEGDEIAWVRMPNVAILNDCQPWWDDRGVRTRWVDRPENLAGAKAVVIPGTKNTIADIRWLRQSGMAEAILAVHARGASVFGICGGYQILGSRLSDPQGVAGDQGEEQGLGLLPGNTEFLNPKIVRQTESVFGGQRWGTYEIHMGRTSGDEACEPLQQLVTEGRLVRDGVRHDRVWGTYQHGWFESPTARSAFASRSGIAGHVAFPQPWHLKRRALYDQMGDWLVEHVDMEPVRRYLGLR